MTIKELANDCNKYSGSQTSSCQYDNIKKMRNKTLMLSFVRAQKEYAHKNDNIIVSGVEYECPQDMDSINKIWLYMERLQNKIVWVINDISSIKSNILYLRQTIEKKVKTIIIVKQTPLQTQEKQIISNLKQVTHVEVVDNIRMAVKLASMSATQSDKVVYTNTQGKPSEDDNEFKNQVTML